MMIDLDGKVWCYYVDQSMVNEQGEFQPCIIAENEPGYYPTDWSWGKDWEIAQKARDSKNANIGVISTKMFEILDSSMRESNVIQRIKRAKRKTLPLLVGLPKSVEGQILLEKRLKA